MPKRWASRVDLRSAAKRDINGKKGWLRMRAILVSAVVLMAAGVAMGAEAGKTLTVKADGSGDFKTVQEAVNAASGKTTIHLGAGEFQGPVVIPAEKTGITLVGEGPEKTVITWAHNVYEPGPAGADKFNPGLHVRGDDFTAENLTVQNTSGDHGQALAVRVDADRVVMRNCHITGWQDTLMVNVPQGRQVGRQYFDHCYIEGRVDFIYGSGTAVFDHCEIHSKNGGHVTAASTPEDHPFGFVFLDCKLTGDDVPWNPATTNPATTQKVQKANKMADLGRPWRPYAAVAYIRCEMEDHIKPTGWNNWGKASNEKTARYSEFESTGPGGKGDQRVPWAKQLTAEEAGKYTVENVLGGGDRWDPRK
ncbi:MAG: pectinesterase family protein [Phycisphaerae bacterium]